MVQADDEALEGLSEKGCIVAGRKPVHSQLKLTRREEECFPA